MLDDKLLAEFGKLQLQRESVVAKLQEIEQQMGIVRQNLFAKEIKETKEKPCQKKITKEISKISE